MRNLPIFLLAILGIGLGAFSWNQHQKSETLTAQIVSMEKTIAARDGEIAKVNQAKEKLAEENRVFADESTGLRARLASQPVATPVPVQSVVATPEPSADKKNPFGGMMEKMMKNPKMLDAIAAQQMAAIKPMYADLVKQLKLTPAETEEFFKLLGEQTTQAMQAGMKAMSGDKDALDEITGSKDGLKAFLGERYSQFEAYQKTVPDRAQLTQINAQMAARQTPLRPDQSNGILQIMQQEKLNTAKFSKANVDPENTQFDQARIDDTYSAMEERNNRVLARTKTLLNPDQWQAFSEQQKQTLQMQKMGMEMAKGMFSQPSK